MKMGQKTIQSYLYVYNLFSTSLWSIVFVNTLLGFFVGQPFLFELTNKFTTGVQCCAVLEIFNAIAGYVKAPIFTTTIQVLSRLLIVIGIFQLLPNSPANGHWVYITLCLSWSITEVLRYGFYASKLYSPNGVPPFLLWCRYSLFVVLYPTGVASEVTMIYMSLPEADKVFGPYYLLFLKLVLLIYLPGLFILYSYMLQQRKKVLGQEQRKKETKRE